MVATGDTGSPFLYHFALPTEPILGYIKNNNHLPTGSLGTLSFTESTAYDLWDSSRL